MTFRLPVAVGPFARARRETPWAWVLPVEMSRAPR